METPRLRRKAVIVVVTLVAGSGLLAYASYRPNLERARARISTGSRIAASRCGPIEYAEAGAGPPVLLVHGAGGGFDQGLEVGEGLARAGFRAIAPSRFGYLRTPLPADASVEAQADAHACLLDALGVESAAIVGGTDRERGRRDLFQVVARKRGDDPRVIEEPHPARAHRQDMLEHLLDPGLLLD